MKRCDRRVPFETLVAWWARELGEAESMSLEEHLFACDECAAASEALGRLVGGLSELIPPVISEARRARLVKEGVRVRNTPCAAGGTATALFSKDVDILVHELRGDLSRAERVDLEILAPDGSPVMRLEHVPFDAKKGEVLIACQRHYRHTMGEGETPTFRLHVTEGSEKRSADYLVIHVWE